MVSGTVSGHWDITGSPYIVIGDIDVPEDEFLTIAAGVEVRFSGKYQLEVFGDLQVNGTSSEPIRFTSDKTPPEPGDWEGIFFWNSKADSYLRYAIVEYAVRGIDITTIDADNSVLIANAWIRYNEENGVSIYARGETVDTYARPMITNSTISENGWAGIYTTGVGGRGWSDGYAEPIIRNNTIYKNGKAGIEFRGRAGNAVDANGHVNGEVDGNIITQNGGEGIFLQGSGSYSGCRNYFCISGTVSPKITNNTIANNDSHGVWIDGHVQQMETFSRGKANPYLANNLITGNGDSGIYGHAYWAGEQVEADILNNTIVGNVESGILINVRAPNGGRLWEIYNNIIVSNTFGIDAGSSEVSDIWCNELWDNETDFVDLPPEFGMITSTNANGDPSDSYWNLFLDPQFVDRLNQDYHLRDVSPAIDA
ncbi:unnamed protein product, partial [marine sediment metagenome]